MRAQRHKLVRTPFMLRLSARPRWPGATSFCRAVPRKSVGWRAAWGDRKRIVNSDRETNLDITLILGCLALILIAALALFVEAG